MIDKSKVKKYVGSALVVTLIAGGVIAKGVEVERNVDHVRELCPFVSILGLEHQANAINNADLVFYRAVYTNNEDGNLLPDTYLYDSETKEKTIVPGVISGDPEYINENGEEVHMIPYPYHATGASHKGETDGVEKVAVYRYDPGALQEGQFSLVEKERIFEKDEEGIRKVETNYDNPDYEPSETKLGIVWRDYFGEREKDLEEKGRTK